MMDLDQDYDDMRAAIARERARNLENARAFGEVVRLRTDLAIVQTKLASAMADQSQHSRPTSPEHRGWRERTSQLRQHVEEIEADLAAAESYCKQVNPDQLQRHDEDLARAAEAARRTREEEEAERDRALAEGRQRAAIRAVERMQQRARIEAEEIALLAGGAI